MKRRKALIIAAVVIAIVAAIIISLPSILRAAGLHPNYSGTSYQLSGKRALIVTTSHGTLGDTGKATGVYASGVDILFCKALSLPMVSVIERYSSNSSSARIAHDIPDYHSSPEDAAKMAGGAGAGMLVLYHIIPPTSTAFLYPVFFGDAESYYSRQISLGNDGMMLSLPPGTKAVRQSRRFQRIRS